MGAVEFAEAVELILVTVVGVLFVNAVGTIQPLRCVPCLIQLVQCPKALSVTAAARVVVVASRASPSARAPRLTHLAQHAPSRFASGSSHACMPCKESV